MNASAPGALRASVIIPAYYSEGTAAATLASLRAQTIRDFEVILVDSAPTDALAGIAADFPEVRFHHASERLLPHAARNTGVALARSDVLVFTDPDVVAPNDWLEKLLTAFEKNHAPVAGGVASLHDGWLETGVHLAKFDLWLPGGEARAIPLAPTVNFVCSRRMWEQVGGFDGKEIIGDTLFSWELVDAGHTLQLIPQAVLYHDHRSTFRQLLRERFERGRDFARLRHRRENWSTARTYTICAASILPIRLPKLLWRTFACCLRAGCVRDYLRTLPVVLAGHAAWLAGEASHYFRQLRPAR